MDQKTPSEIINIWQLLCHYCHLVDRGGMDEVVGLFHPDGTLSAPPQSPSTGHDAIREGYNDWYRTAHKPTVWLRHQINTPVIEVNGNRASSACYFTADFLSRKKNTVQALMGRYEDDLIHMEEGWRIWKRTLIVHARMDFGTPK
jgi:hypothetical protein